MWMNRNTLKLASGAKNGVATRPSHRLTVELDEAEWWLASCATVNSRYAVTALIAVETGQGHAPARAAAVDPRNTAAEAANSPTVGQAMTGTGSPGSGMRRT